MYFTHALYNLYYFVSPPPKKNTCFAIMKKQNKNEGEDGKDEEKQQ